MTPLVSVITPAFNAGRYIGETIASVQGQTWRDWELLVVDDGSSDDTADRVREFLWDRRIRLLSQSNCGVSAARNAGLRLARGSYIAFLDADDAWKPENLERKLHALTTTPSVD